LENYKLEKKIQAKLKEQKRKKYERFHILPAEFSPLSEEKRLMKVSRKGGRILLFFFHKHSDDQ
jgi:hypothetical protein